MNNQSIESLLENLGFRKRTFYYAIGGGEDENDMEIWVNDNTALGQYGDNWFKTHIDLLNYSEGFPDTDPIEFHAQFTPSQVRGEGWTPSKKDWDTVCAQYEYQLKYNDQLAERLKPAMRDLIKSFEAIGYGNIPQVLAAKIAVDPPEFKPPLTEPPQPQGEEPEYTEADIKVKNPDYMPKYHQRLYSDQDKERKDEMYATIEEQAEEIENLKKQLSQPQQAGWSEELYQIVTETSNNGAFNYMPHEFRTRVAIALQNYEKSKPKPNE